MLACVSTLTEIVSYEDVRHNKEWLTTNEAFCYIRDNCPALFCMMQSRHSNDYTTMYNWTLSCKNDYNRKRPKLDVRRVQDNGRRDVVFWNVETLKSEEKNWAYTFQKGWCSYYWRDAINAYNELLKKNSEAPRGSFYDPEWFN